MDKQRMARIKDSQTGDDITMGRAVHAAKREASQLPKLDKALNLAKLQALYSFQGDVRRGLSKEFERIDRRHYCHNGISRVEYRRETMEAINEWL